MQLAQRHHRATSQFALLHDCNNPASGLSPMAPNLRSNQPNHSMKNNKLKCTTVGALASVAFCANAAAQSPDALLDKLVQKGILTRQEADDLRRETDTDSSKANAQALSQPRSEKSDQLGDSP